MDAARPANRVRVRDGEQSIDHNKTRWSLDNIRIDRHCGALESLDMDVVGVRCHGYSFEASGTSGLYGPCSTKPLATAGTHLFVPITKSMRVCRKLYVGADP